LGWGRGIACAVARLKPGQVVSESFPKEKVRKMKKVAILFVLVLTTNAMAEGLFKRIRNARQGNTQTSSYPTKSHTQGVQYGQQQPTYSNGGGQDLLSMINNYRAQNGLNALAYNPSLNLADGYGPTHHGKFKRSGMSGVSNWSGSSDAQTTFNMWVKSDGHRANMLAPNATSAGIGYNHTGTTFTAQ
jgi:uncharacterized protein YkwD